MFVAGVCVSDTFITELGPLGNEVRGGAVASCGVGPRGCILWHMSDYRPVAHLSQSLRNRYLASLPEPQEWFLEEMVREGEVWEAPGVGYGVFHGERLVEFYVTDGADAALQLAKLLRRRPFAAGLCKSFDAVLLGAAKTLGWGLVETGFLFRKRGAMRVAVRDGFAVRQAEPGDLARVWATGNDFYDGPEDVARLFDARGLWVAQYQGQMVGSGVMIPIDGSGVVVDIGMVTRPDQRNRGFASAVICALADHLEDAGKRPVCGCAQGNLASKSALEKAGFVSEHRLVQLHLPGTA